MLNLANGDYVSGQIVSCPEPRCFGWHSSAFTANLQFPIKGVSSIHFTPPEVMPEPAGAYGIELLGGDLIFGTLLRLDAESAEFDVPDLGEKLRIDRAKITRLYRRGTGNEQLYVGPSGLNGWKTIGEPRAWREINGYLATNKPETSLRRQFNIPARARMEFELSWSSQPDFDLAIGVGEKPETVAQAFHIEVWDNHIVLQRTLDKEADLAPLQVVLGQKDEHLHVQAFLDQEAGRMLVFSTDGVKLADLTVRPSVAEPAGTQPGLKPSANVAANLAPKKPEVYGGIQLTNRKGDIRLERLQIGNWNGEPPQQMSKDKSRIHGTDGTIAYGQLKSFDPEKREFVIGTAEESKTIPEEKVQDLFMSAPTDMPLCDLRAISFSGFKVSGDYLKVEAEKLWLQVAGIESPIGISLNSLQSVLVLKPTSETADLPARKSRTEVNDPTLKTVPAANPAPANPTHRMGRLEVNGLTLQGTLVDGKVTDEGGLNWLPASSSQSAPFRKGISGQIVYREPPATKVVAAEDDATQPRNAGPVQQRALRTRSAATTKPIRKGTKAEKAMLHLRTGDTVPCEAISLDENGLTFKSSVTDSTFVPNHQIQALELLPNVARREIDPNKKSRLLTVPRMQRTNPPTHLIRSVDGDYLRGRLISMDADGIQVELRADAKTVPRDKVARILWLHPENSETPEKKPGDGTDQSNLIQALPSDGNRLTFVPELVESGILIGKSELLGACKVDLQAIDQLFMGFAIDQATADLPFQWKLKKSADPLGPKEGSEGSEEGSEGMESVLVGKMAPAIDLKALDGSAFQLSSCKGKIVILDFWASWCGPCLQVMPQVDRVAHEFADQGVVLYAVNLEESADKVKAALERLKLSTTVLLDKDGRVAEKYGATSIPQTVIIDREGKVARLYVGGNSRFDEQLRTALKSVLAGESPKGN